MTERRSYSLALAIGCALGMLIAIVRACAPIPASAAHFTLPFNDVTETTENVGTGVTLPMPGSGHAVYKLTFSQSAAVVLTPANWSGQTLTVFVCQDGTGGWTPTFNRAGGLNLHWHVPPWQKTASQCEGIGLVYTDPLNVYMTGYVLSEP